MMGVSQSAHGSDLESRLDGLFRAEAARSDISFADLALEVFRYQFDHNPHYRAYARSEGTDPDSLRDWTRIPLVPTRAFKELPLCCGDPAEAEAVFKTSGTTRGEKRRGTHYVRSLALYESSLVAGFRQWVLPDRVRPHILSLVRFDASVADSSLGHMAAVVADRLCGEVAAPVVDDRGLDVEAAVSVLKTWSQQATPVLLFTTALALASLLDELETRGVVLELPPSSRVMETGGFKGRRQQVTRDEIRAQVARHLGVGPRRVVSEYGMTEMLSQFYDGVLADPNAEPGVFRGPAWVRTRVLDPSTLEPARAGEVGVLAHYDLANLHSVSALLTEDLGRETGQGFELLGRAQGSELRGCSLAFEELVAAQKGSNV